MLLDEPYEEKKSQFSKSTRKNIEQAQRNGLTVRKGTEEDLETMEQLFESTATRKDFFYRKLDYYQEMYKYMHDLMTIYFAHLDPGKYLQSAEENLQEEERKNKEIQEKMQKDMVGAKLKNQKEVSDNRLVKLKEELENAFKQNPKALILCNPSNPCGKVFSKEELEYIASLAVKYDTYVITDEVYEHIVYAPYKHTYFASLPGMFERTISCSSLSKTYSITGWRLGYCIAPENIIEQIKKVHDFLTVGAAAPLQEAAVVGLEFSDAYYDELQKLYTHKKDLFLNGLKELNIPHTEPQGAYYVMVDISEFGYDSDLDFCVDLIKNVGVAAVPGSSFFKEKENRYIRFHFAKKDETLFAALNRLKDMHTKMPYKKTVG